MDYTNSANRRVNAGDALDATISSMGQSGAVVITDTSAITGEFKAIQVLADATFTTLTADHTTNDLVTQSVGADYGTLFAGQVIYGKFTAITLASGVVIAYK